MASATFKSLGIIYPARKHAVKVYAHLLASDSFKSTRPPALYLQGHGTTTRDDSDREMPFRQEANFMYLTGASNIREASVLVTLSANAARPPKEDDITTTLFLPPVDPLEVMWSGLPASPEQVHSDLPALSSVVFHDDSAVSSLLKSAGVSSSPDGAALLTLPLTPSPHGLPSGYKASPSQALLNALHEARTVKTKEEIDIMRNANAISSRAHDAVMKGMAVKACKSESEAEAVWTASIKMEGAKQIAYESIFAYGTHAGTLHYIANNAPFDRTPHGCKGALLLIDAGCEMDTYASDITRVVPVANGGKFTNECRGVYQAVLDMQEEALKMIKAGADWEAIQLHMHLVAARGLLKLGILKGAPAEKLVEEKATVPFFPHGIGHFLGIDTHDVGGLPDGRSTDPRIRYLRLRRKLEAGNVVTVEPGLYFNDYLLEPVKDSPYLDPDVLKKFMYVGGVRIEDNVVVTEDGYDNLTTAAKTAEAVEQLCTP